MAVADNGGQDLWGNPVPSGAGTDRGANEWVPGVPGITNQSPVITSSNVTLKALVNPNGAATAWYFRYGTTTAYGSSTGTVVHPPNPADQSAR